MTIVANRPQRPAELPLRRELVALSDGGTVAIDWYDPFAPDRPAEAPYGTGGVHERFTHATRPTMIILHGLTGSSREAYVANMMLSFAACGFRTVAMNNRGCGGLPLQTPQIFSAAGTQDLREVVTHIRSHVGAAALLMAVGVSLGSIILVKYVAEEGEQCPLAAAMALSNPWDLISSADMLTTRFISRRLYNYRLARKLRAYVATFVAAHRAAPRVCRSCR